MPEKQFTVSQLSKLVGTPFCPRLIDVCIDEDFAADPRLIPGAIRHPYAGIGSLAGSLGSRKVVVICQKGLKLSQGAAAMLRSEGIDASFLSGGNLAWGAAGGPMVPVANMPEKDASGRTVWVCSEQPSLGLLACLWLVRRFLDHQAVFLFVEDSQVAEVSDRFSAKHLPIDRAVSFTAGEVSAFEGLFKAFGLETSALRSMAAIMRFEVEESCGTVGNVSGFKALLSGLRQGYPDELAFTDAVFPVLDAVYNCCRDKNHLTNSVPVLEKEITP